MANYKAVANGNWSALATWQDDSSGSFVASTVLPGASDVVYFNNFTVQMDVDVTVLEIRNDSSTGVAAGGGGVISTSRTVNADLYSGAQTTFITVSATAPSIVNITGNLPGTKVVNFSRAMTVSGNCTLNFVGNIVGTAPSVGARQDVKGIVLTAPATLNVTGDVYGGTNIASSTTSSENIGIWSSTTAAVINVVGNLDGGTGQRNRAIQTSTNDTLTVTGNVFGGTGSGTGSPISGILLNSFSPIPCSIVGSVSSGLDSYGVLGGQFGSPQLKITGNVINHSTGRMAVFNVPFLFLESTNMSWEFRKLDLTTNTLYTPGVNTGHPAEANVRTGVVYGPTNNLTGTCAVPPANTVSLGVPVDNTVGTAQLDANALAIALDAALTASLTPALTTSLNASLSASLPSAIAPLLWDEDVANLTTPNSIGERVKNCATVATTGAQIASFNP